MPANLPLCISTLLNIKISIYYKQNMNEIIPCVLLNANIRI